MRMPKRLSVHFIIQAQKSIGIKKVIEENKDKEVIVVDYKKKRKRWGIETSYRVKKDAFRPNTTSKNHAIRLFFFLFSVSFYNLLVLVSIVPGLVLYGRLPGKPLITAKMFGNLLITTHDSGG